MFLVQGGTTEIFKPQEKPNVASLEKWQVCTGASQTLVSVAGLGVSANHALPV